MAEKIRVDLDEFWPPTSELIGLLFDSDDDFAQCQTILPQDWDTFRLVNSGERYLVVPKSDVHRFAQAGLGSREVELIDIDL